MEIRTVTAGELEAYSRAAAVAFGQTFDAARSEAMYPTIELDRSLAAFEGTDIVGTARSSALAMTVPGGSRPAAAVQSVTVLPTHRRRGLLTALMRRQLDDARAGGDTLACLWATEAPIYRRFGYGPATTSVSWEADRRDVRFSPQAPDPGGLEVRLAPGDTGRKEIEAVYERLRPLVPGMLERPAVWWDRYLRDPEGAVLRVVVAGPDGPVGYASYRVEGSWGYRGPDNRLSVGELLGVSPTAVSALWRYVFGVDLVATVSAYNRPPDDSLEWLLTDPRALRRRVNDALWIRLVDVGAALGTREWSSELSVRLSVRDDFCPWNERVWSLEAGPGGGEARPSSGPSDLEMDAASLASLYLGGHRAATLARAGLVDEHTPGALRALDRALAGDRLPWTVSYF